MEKAPLNYNRLNEANYIAANQSHIYSTYSAENSEYHINNRKITMIMFHIDQFCGWKDYPTLTILLGSFLFIKENICI